MKWLNFTGYAGLFAYVWAYRNHQDNRRKQMIEAFRLFSEQEKPCSHWVWKQVSENKTFCTTLSYKGIVFYEAHYDRKTHRWSEHLPCLRELTNAQQRFLQQQTSQFLHADEEASVMLSSSIMASEERRAIRRLKEGLVQIKERKSGEMVTEIGGESYGS